jgi:hypothetical protein
VWNDRYRFDLAEMAALDPATMLAVGVGSTIAGGGLSAASTLAGGNWAKAAGLATQQADNFQAAQLRRNAGIAIGTSQVKMFDTQTKTGLAESTSTARAAASGVDAGTGSAAMGITGRSAAMATGGGARSARSRRRAASRQAHHVGGEHVDLLGRQPTHFARPHPAGGL